MKPTVSVIIPCYNGAKYLAEAVDSVLAQTFTDLECLIVDDGSTDPTRQVGEKLAKKDPRVKYFYKDNAGVAAARNFAVDQAQGDWIQFLDADDWLHKDKLNFQLNHLHGYGPDDSVVFYSDYEVVYQDEKGQTTKKISQISGNLSNDQLLERMVTWQFKPDFPAPLWSLLISKPVFGKKMMNEQFKGYSDFEFLVSLLLLGVPFIYTPIVGVSYRKHTTSITKKPWHKDYYIALLEFMQQEDEELLRNNPNIAKLLGQAIQQKNKNWFDRLIRMIDKQQKPVPFFNGRLKTKNRLLLRAAFFLRPLVR